MGGKKASRILQLWTDKCSLQVSINFGPYFKYPPRDITYRPVSNSTHLPHLTAFKQKGTGNWLLGGEMYSRAAPIVISSCTRSLIVQLKGMYLKISEKQ